MCLLLQGRMLPLDRLRSWGLQVESNRVMCQGADETREQLFVDCHYRRIIRSRIMTWLQRQAVSWIDWEQLLGLTQRSEQ